MRTQTQRRELPKVFQGTKGKSEPTPCPWGSTPDGDIETPETQPGCSLVSPSCRPRVVSFLPSLHHTFSRALQVGIQVVSEDLCSEKQWSVCKALATFVAHRELSKVDICPRCSVIPTLPPVGPSAILPRSLLLLSPSLPAYFKRRSLQNTAF